MFLILAHVFFAPASVMPGFAEGEVTCPIGVLVAAPGPRTIAP
jgi:hypothetical protein